MWVETEQLQTRFDPKATVRGRWRDPPLHCLLRHGDYKHTQLKVLAQEFLEKKADPLLVNNNKETVLHIVCTSERHSKRVSQARRDVLALLMEDLPDGVGNGYPAWLELPDAVSVVMLPPLSALFLLFHSHRTHRYTLQQLLVSLSVWR